jgi:hypothetical protein
MASSAAAVELAIQFPALERILGQQMFTEEGKRYVRGSKATPCHFAYLEQPKISAESDRLHVQAHFSGKSAADLFGHCIGLGDAFDLAITAVPYYHDGLIGFRDVRVKSLARDGFYIRRVCGAMAQSLSRDFQYRLFDDARRILEEKRPNAPFSQQVRAFQVPRIRVTGDALIVTLEFDLLVK